MKYSYAFPDTERIDLINHDLERFADEWCSSGATVSLQPVEAFCDVMLRGGKRLRGILAMQSYQAYGGRNENVALGAARVFEIIQTSLLVVDDIADHSRMRRGGPSAYAQLEEEAQRSQMKVDPLHFGQVQGMNIAYAGLHQATIELLNLGVSAEVARVACKQFHENIATTISGQIDDIYNEATRSVVSQQAIESVLRRKSAYYTVLSPLELGAMLAGGQLSPTLKEYAVHAGCAYQIADDIISTFGREDETGKGSNDDIREGKLTLLAFHAREHASAQQRKILDILGRGDATDEQCDAVRSVMNATGALQFARERLRFYETAALKTLENETTISADFKEYLKKFTDHLVNRRS